MSSISRLGSVGLVATLLLVANCSDDSSTIAPAATTGSAGAGAAGAPPDGGPLCNNGVLDPGEECDGDELGGATCEGLGHSFGELSCDEGCALDRTGCYECGDGYGHVLDENAAQWLSHGWEETLSSGSGWRRSRAIWALLEDRDGENLYQTHEETLRHILRAWTGNHCPNIGELVPEDPYYWGFAFLENCMAEVSWLTRILLQYPDRVPADVLECIEMLIPGAIEVGAGNPNTEVVRWAPIYLMALEDRQATMVCPDSRYWDTGFSWGSNAYTVGETYNTLELARDYWLWRLDEWSKYWDLGGNENDNESYTWLFIHALMTLVDFADRPVDALGGEPDPEGIDIKNRAQMVLDLVLLDNILDYSANQHGGHLGRHYYDTLVGGYQMNFYDLYWNQYVEAARRFPAVSSYRIPYVIEDLGILSDEPDGYWHVNRENDAYGKWTWVADDWNLGGGTNADVGYMTQWILNLRTNDTGDVTPFTMFVSTYETYEPIDVYGYANAMGEWGYLWRYAGLIRSWGSIDQYLHVIANDAVFDEVRGAVAPQDPCGAWELTEDWALFREGDVMVAVGNEAPWLMSVEIAEIGVDYDGTVYQSLDDFEAALEQTAFLGNQDGYDMYVTSRGDTIALNPNPADNEYMWTLVKPAGEAQLTPMYEWPAEERIAAEDWQGQPMVSWSGRTMTVQRHGCTRHYDFDSWSAWNEYSAECPICQPVQ